MKGTIQPHTITPSQPKLLFFASCYGCGLTGALTEMAVALGCQLGQRLLCVSGEAEQFPGLYAELTTNKVSFQVIQGLDEHRDFGRLGADLTRIIETFGPDIVQVQSNWQLFIAALARKKSSRPFRIAYWVHGYRNNYPWRSLITSTAITLALAVWADVVIVTSPSVHRRFRILGRKLRSLCLGLSPALLTAYSPLNATSNKKRLMFAAEFRYGKGQDWLILFSKE